MGALHPVHHRILRTAALVALYGSACDQSPAPDRGVLNDLARNGDRNHEVGGVLRYHAEGFTDPPNEGPFPGAVGPSFPRTEFSLDVVFETEGSRLRIDRTGTNPGPGFTIDQIERIDGEVGVAEGLNALGIPLGPIPSDRVAALVRTQRLTNPTILVREAVEDPSLVLDLDVVWYGYVPVLVVELDDEVAPIVLELALIGGPRVFRATTQENDLLLRDTEVEIYYDDWAHVAGFGFMPHEVEVWHDGHLVRSEQRSDATGLVPVGDDEIEVPADELPPVDAALASLGERSSQAQLSFPPPISYPDGRPSTVFPVELAPGVHFLSGTLHNSMLVEQEERLVLVEAPAFPERSAAIAAWADATFEDKTITHVIATHHHSDHTAGLRHFVAAGASIVVGESSVDFFEDDVFARSSTIVPDALSALGEVDADVIGVPDDEPWVLDDDTHPVMVVPVASEHALDMVVAHLPEDGVLFNSDLYTPDFPATNEEALLAGATELNTAIEAFELDVALMPAGHGFAVRTYAEFEAEFGF